MMPITENKESHTVAFNTLGCKTNQLETSTIAHMFTERGWAVVPFDEGASVSVINTCTVTERSDNESLRVIRKAKLANPEGKIVVTGCFAQVAPDLLAQTEGVNFVVGNNFKDEIVELVEKTELNGKPIVKVSEIDKSRILEGAGTAAVDESGNTRTRASLKIQDGCDYKCTYCIIWEARGKSRSLPVEDVKVHLQRLVDEGFKEIGLTGINIGQYEFEGHDLADLLSVLISIDGDFRLRLTSLDPLEVSNKLIDVIANSNGKIAPHLHLAAQSCEDVVLKRMGRRHHVNDMVYVCETFHQKIPHGSIGSDIIVGFPCETDERFEKTYNVLRDVPMNYFHVFSYSKRRGTPAADFEEQVPEHIKKDRATRLKKLSEEKHETFRKQFVGKTLPVIVEGDGTTGTSDNYIRVQFDVNTPALESNDLVEATIVGIDPKNTLVTV